ncbi:MAG TPA: hypothetical protein VMW27_16200 [Thermoanaerobaculia bacterium]|nr:hypothetical protein [Thermoanaerobaculia bacterium]
MRAACRIHSVLFFLWLPLARGAAGAPLVYDFRAPGAAPLADCVSAIHTVDGLPLEIEAGLMSPEGVFSLGEGSSKVALLRNGLGVLSAVGAGSPPEGGLSRSEALVFRFSEQFAPASVALSGFTRGNGSSSLEMVRVFVNGAFFADVPGVDRGTVTLPLPEDTRTLAVTPVLAADGVRFSPSPVLFVSRIEGERADPDLGETSDPL